MALDFPSNPEDNDDYSDDCGNIWLYDSTDNKWTLQSADSSDGIWEINYTDGIGTISPVDEFSVLSMGIKDSDINLFDFPETT